MIAKAGGSKRTIYDYFGNKEALFAAIVKEIPARALPPLAADDEQRRRLTGLARRCPRQGRKQSGAVPRRHRSRNRQFVRVPGTLAA
jgi:AcrR family transcriptional regulator